MRGTPILVLLWACTPEEPIPTGPDGRTSFPDPDASAFIRGPGGPAVEFDDAALFDNCAYLEGGPTSFDHHNLLLPYRGHLVLPWAAEWGTGGISLFEMDDPCSPVKVGETEELRMRETHAAGFAHLGPDTPAPGDWVVVNQLFGIEFWDLSDVAAPRMVAELELPGVRYPDSYARVAFAMFWQYPWVYVAGSDNGVYVVDATDPTDPILMNQVTLDSGLRAAGVFALGNLLLVTGSEQTSAEVLDIAVPTDPQPIAGSSWQVQDGDGLVREYYAANTAGDLVYFARKDEGGGAIAYDWSDPAAPTFVSDLHVPAANGGYVFQDEGYLFVGGSHMAHVLDAHDPTNLRQLGVGHLTGDLDTITPYGNVALLSVDDGADPGQATAVMPWNVLPDGIGPEVIRVHPPDGAEGLAVTTRIGVAFNEMVEPSSVFAGSIRLYDAADAPISGWGSAQEGIASYTPAQPLLPGTTYRVEIMAGGIADANGNTLRDTFVTSFTTAL